MFWQRFSGFVLETEDDNASCKVRLSLKNLLQINMVNLNLQTATKADTLCRPFRGSGAQG